MSSRSRSSRERHKGGHAHCDSCYTRRCRARIEPSVCCPLSTCRLLCGALYHLCKEEDHLLLCPNVRVPCINVEFGCPLQMLRSSRAEHLQFCPASLVSCSMEWLRWPEDETNPNGFLALQENLLKERCERREERCEEALDVSLALVDQSELYSRLKMKPLYPELMEQGEEEEEEERKAESAAGGTVNGEDEEEQALSLPAPVSEPVSAEQPVKMSQSQMLGRMKERSSIMDMMFGMERGACTVAESKQDDPTQKDKTGAKQDDNNKMTRGKGDTEKHESAAEAPEVDTSKTGHAPWQQGVLERLGRDLTPQEFNMYIVHHGRMLMAFGHIEACTPRERDFVYGSLEPIPVQTVRSFKIPDSYHYRRRVHLYENKERVQSEAQETDTSDLGTSEDQWFSDEAKMTLLGYAEREVMGHKICEMKASDGLYVDEGTQTFSFRSAPFTSKTKLFDVITDTDGPSKLHLQLQAESVNSRNNRGSAFAFVCGHVFHRREYPTHVRNVHGDIQTALSGWFEQRCPLSYLGCTYSCRRFQPSTHKATVTYNQELKTFNLRPAPVCPLWDDSQTAGEDPLSSLPYEVLCHVASFLDSLSLSQLALVSRLMRQVCSSQLQDKGMVTLRWDRTSSSRGRSLWRATPVWEFSHLFSKVDSWHFSEISSISSHLKVCPFYEQYVYSARVPLHSLSTKQKNTQKTTLVDLFTKNSKK